MSEALDGVERRVEALRALQKENDQLRLKLARGESAASGETTEVDGVPVITRRADGHFAASLMAAPSNGE